MPLKDLLVLVGSGMQPAERYALWLARTTGARLTAAAAVVEPHLPIDLETALPSEIARTAWEEAEEAAVTALHSYSEAANLAGIEVETFKLEARAGRTGPALSVLARCYDACIIQQPNPSGGAASEQLEAVLFGSGRPLLVVPYIQAASKLETILVAWDGGHHAARAVADAMPLLSLATDIHLISSSGIRDEFRLASGASLARHLQRHGIPASHQTLTGGDIDVANMLLSYAADLGADLIVMGGYGHSRLRELVLGGTTREILRSMTVPVLMTH